MPREAKKKILRHVKKNSLSSPIMQVGVVFLIIAAMVLFAYVYKNFT